MKRAPPIQTSGLLNMNAPDVNRSLSRRSFLAGSVAATMGATLGLANRRDENLRNRALVCITLDLEMSRHYPRRGMMEWDYQKGNLDEPTKRYSVEAARVAKERGGLIHFFCVGRVLEQPNIDWLKQLHAEGHPIGNHTYDHVNVLATDAAQAQFRFQRSPWLAGDRPVRQLIEDNIRLTQIALRERAGIKEQGFRTPGGFHNGMNDRPDLQRMFVDLGYDWISSKYPKHLYGEPKQEPAPDVYESIVEAQAAAQPFKYPNGLIEIPMSPISDVGAFRSTFWKLDYFLKAIRIGVEWAIANKAVFDFLAHPSCLVVEDPGFETIKLICDLVRDAGDKAAIVDLSTVAQRVRNA